MVERTKDDEAFADSNWEGFTPHHLFLRLWTKAVGTPYYNKKQWKKLELALLERWPVVTDEE